jgi:hypothetical protein
MNEALHMTIDLPAKTNLAVVSQWCAANGVTFDQTNHVVNHRLMGRRYRFTNIEEKMLFGMRWL